jgi:hypothetical protein
MASEEEVDITIKLHADTAEAKQVSDAIKDAQRSASEVQPAGQFPTSQRITDAANAAKAFNAEVAKAGGFEQWAKALAGEAPAGAATGEKATSVAFETLQRAQQRQLAGGVDPQEARLYAARAQQQRQFESLIQERARTAARGGVVPTDMMPEGALARFSAARDAIGEVGKAAAEAGEKSAISTMSMLRFTGALFGVGVGFSIFRAAGAELHQFFATLIEDVTNAAQAVQDNTIIYGQNAAAFQQWAGVISQQAGVAATELIQAGNAAQQFGRQIGFGPDQTRGLEAAATLLARIKGIGVDQAMTLLTSAIQGNAQAAASLNLQLDAGYIAFTELGGATAEVFNQLGTGEQEWLRYQSALLQTAKQAGATVPALTDLRKAQQELNKEWNDFVNTAGPGILTLLSGIAGGAAAAAKAIADLNEATVKRNQEGGKQDPGFKNELALLDQVKNKLGDLADTDAGKAITQQLDALRQKVVEINAASSDPGFQNELVAVSAATQDVTSKLDELKKSAADALDLPGGHDMERSLSGAADQADRASGFFETMAEHYQKVVDLANQLAPAQQALQAALSNEEAASQALVNYKSQSLSLTADEARIRLEMLPVQERLAEAANAAAQAQLRAQQAALPSSRAQQDLQNQIRLYTLIAQSPDRSMQERQNALATATALTRRTPEADIAALQAQMATIGPTRAAEDIANAQRMQALQQAQALQPFEYQKQQIDLLGQIATAAMDAAHRTFEFTVQAINFIFQGTGLELTDTDRKNIADMVGQGVLDAFDAAIKSSDKRAASSSLIAAVQAS